MSTMTSWDCPTCTGRARGSKENFGRQCQKCRTSPEERIRRAADSAAKAAERRAAVEAFRAQTAMLAPAQDSIALYRQETETALYQLLGFEDRDAHAEHLAAHNAAWEAIDADLRRARRAGDWSKRDGLADRRLEAERTLELLRELQIEVRDEVVRQVQRLKAELLAAH